MKIEINKQNFLYTKCIYRYFCTLTGKINYKNFILFCFIFLIFSFFTFSCNNVYADKPRIYVMPFECSYYQYSSLRESLPEILKSRLSQTKKVELVEREVLDKIKQEIDYKNNEYFDSSTIPEKGKFIGATYIIKGKVLDVGHYTKDTTIGSIPKLTQVGGFQHTKVTAYIRFSVDVIHVETAKTIFSTEVEGKNQSQGATIVGSDLEKIIAGGIKVGSPEFNNSMLGKAIKQAFDKLMPKLLALPIYKHEFKIIGISKNELVINAGQEDNIKKDQKCKIFTLKVIRNNAGKIVWENKKFITYGIVKEVSDNKSLLEIDNSFTKFVKEGDIVEFEY